MTLPPLPLIDGCLFIDNSGWVESLQTCSRYLQYKQLNKRITASESDALNFGSALHLALEFRYRNYGSQQVDAAYYEAVGQILTDFFAAHPPSMDDHRNLNWAMEILRRYNDRHVVEPFSLLKFDEEQKCPQCQGNKLEPIAGVADCSWCSGTGRQDLMVELPFVLPLFDYHRSWPSISKNDILPEVIKVFYTGKIDLPLIRDNELFVMDHKTASMLGTTFFTGKKMSSQLKGYCWAFQTLTNRQVNGFAVNVIRSSSPPAWVTASESESKRGSKKSLTQWWEETLQREFYRVTPKELVEWKENVIATIKRFFWEYSQGYLPMNTESCVRYGKCQYYDVCSLQPKEDRMAYLLSGLYKDNTWSPLKTPTQSKQ